MNQWKLVPVEPTEEMIKALLGKPEDSWAEGYAAMIAAAPAPDVQPVAWLHVGGVYREEPDEWELEAEQGLCDELNDSHINKPTALPLYTHPPAADVRELVDALRGVVEVMEPLSPLDSLRYHTAQEVLKKWEPE